MTFPGVVGCENIGKSLVIALLCCSTDVAAMQSVRVKTWQPCSYPVHIADSAQQLVRKPLIAPTPLLRRMKSRWCWRRCRVRACPRSRCRPPGAPAGRCQSASSSRPIPGGRISRVEGRRGARALRSPGARPTGVSTFAHRSVEFGGQLVRPEMEQLSSAPVGPVMSWIASDGMGSAARSVGTGIDV
jgi:hypothetical protein